MVHLKHRRILSNVCILTPKTVSSFVPNILLLLNLRMEHRNWNHHWRHWLNWPDEGVQIIMTYPNNDAGGEKMSKDCKKYHSLKILYPTTYITWRFVYHGILALAKNLNGVLLVLEIPLPALRRRLFSDVPTVNIGSRQQGRLRGKKCN